MITIIKVIACCKVRFSLVIGMLKSKNTVKIIGVNKTENSKGNATSMFH